MPEPTPEEYRGKCFHWPTYLDLCQECAEKALQATYRRGYRDGLNKGAEIADKYKLPEHDSSEKECKGCGRFCCSCELCECCSNDYAIVIAQAIQAEAGKSKQI